MNKKGPVFVSNLKNSKKVVRRKKRTETIDAKKAYVFVNKNEKSRTVRALGEISRQIAQVAAHCEDRVASSLPVRIGAHCLKHPLTRKAVRVIKKYCKTK